MQNILNFFQKLAQKPCFLDIPGYYKQLSNFANITGPLPFLLYDLKCQFVFLNDVDIQLKLEFKNSFGQYQPVFKKI